MSEFNRVKIIADILRDGKWHPRNELIKAYYHFADSFYELRRRGVIIEKDYSLLGHQYQYRATNIPEEIFSSPRPKTFFKQVYSLIFG